MSELLPCPFCGGEATLNVKHYGDTHYWRVICPSPFCAIMSVAPTEEKAIEAWNSRAERTCRNTDDEFPFFKCSECGCNAVVGYGSSGDGLPNYCPNCGRKVLHD